MTGLSHPMLPDEEGERMKRLEDRRKVDEDREREESQRIHPSNLPPPPPPPPTDIPDTFGRGDRGHPEA